MADLGLDARLLPLPLHSSLFEQAFAEYLGGPDSPGSMRAGALDDVEQSSCSPPQPDGEVLDVLAKSNVQLKVGPMKTWARAWAKLAEEPDYNGDPARICDIARCTVCFTCPYTMAAYCLYVLHSMTVVRCKNRFVGVPAGEYKDIQLNMEVEFAGVTHIVEVQLALRLMQEIKRPRHKLYKWLRLEKVEDLSAQYVFTEAPPLRPEEVAQRRLSRRKGRAAQGSASTASSRCDSEVGDSGRAAVGAAITAAGAAEDACAVPASRSAGLGSAVTADAALIGTQLQPGLAQPLALAEELGAHVPAMGASMTGRQPRSVAGPQALAIAELEYCASLTSAVKAQGEALAEVSKSFRHASHASPEQRGELLRIQQDLVRQSSQLLRAHSQRPQSGAFGRDRLHHGREDAGLYSDDWPGEGNLANLEMAWAATMGFPNGISEWDFRMGPNPRKSREAQLRAGSGT